MSSSRPNSPWTYCELPAPPPLNELVRCFWFLRGAQAPAEAKAQAIVADGRLEIVLHLGDPFARINDDTASVQASALLCGQLTAPIHLMATGCTDIAGIRFRTATAAAVLTVPLTELTDRIEPLADVNSRFTAALLAAAARSREPAVRVAALSAVLSRAVAHEPDPLATAVVRSLGSLHAPLVSRAAADYGMSVRTIERRVLASTGLAPVMLRRVLRFRRAFRLVDGMPASSWARVAASAGYFDQAHLIRDFQQFAGASPSRFFRSEPDLSRAMTGGTTADE